jgi:DNA topoisomerase-3
MGQEVRGDFKAIEVPCPKCAGGPFKESFKAYECVGCGLIVWKSMAGRELEREEVATVLTEGKVGPLEGFRSKLGRPFNAVVRLNREEWKVEFAFDNAEGGEGKELDLSQARSLGETEGGTIYEMDAAYLCVPKGEKAKPIRMGKNICQRAIPPEQALKIFRDGKSDLLPRFISKKGKPFAAYLKLEDGKVGFEFEPRVKKAPAPKKKAAPKVAAV